MKRTELNTIIEGIRQELGTLPGQVVSESMFQKLTGKRLAGASYKVAVLDNGGTVWAVKYQNRTERQVKRMLYQAIAETIWKSVSYPEIRWIGIVMATPNELPKDVQPYRADYTRSKALRLLTAQIKRIQK